MGDVMFSTVALMLLLFQADTSSIQLPDNVKGTLNIALTVRWKLSQDHLYRCELNGDNLRDYVLTATVGEDNCLVEYNVALIADSAGYYGFYLLGARPKWLGLEPDDIILKHKGEIIPIYEDDVPIDLFEPKQQPDGFILKTDAIEFIPSSGCCATTFVFKNGRFHMFTTSD